MYLEKRIIDVAIIMPCYNVANLVTEAVDSIMNNTYLPREVILINDCSTDNTLEILEILKYQYLDGKSCIKVINNIENIGAFRSREIAIQCAITNFICIVDADDFLDSNSIQACFDKLVSTNADISLFKFYKSSFDGSVRTKMFQDNLHDTIFSGKEACILTLGNWKIGGLGIFDKTLYSIAYSQCSIDTINSDELLTRQVLLNANKVVQSDGKYFYRMNYNSTTQKLSVKHLGLLESNLYLLNFVINNNLASYQIRKNLVKGGIKEMSKIIKHKNIFLKSIQREEFFRILNKFGIKNYLNKLSFMEWVFNTRYFIKAIFIWLKIEVLQFLMKDKI